MKSGMYCLLTDPLIPVRLDSSSERNLSLPGILTALSQGEDIEFPSVRAHQFYAWYSFLVQLAAMAMHKSNQLTLPSEACDWKSMLLNLTQGQFEAFTLIVPDLSKPAFMQSPVPEGTLTALKTTIEQPDVLDILVTARNHDIKAARMIHARPDHWIFSLITLQTTEGFLGAGNYGILRMNGGFASRPCVGVTSSLSWATRFTRDVSVLCKNRDNLIQSYGYRENNGKTLLWLDSWDGGTSLKLADCDPYFIEVCRRVRLILLNGDIQARVGSSKTQRVHEPDLKGNTGDPWTPVFRESEGKALNVGSTGFGYALTAQLLFQGDYQPGMCQSLQSCDSDSMIFTCYALARKNGGTQGIHERAFPIPPKPRKLLGSSTGRNTLGKIAKSRIDIVKVWSREILRPALWSLLQGGPEKLDMKDERTRHWETCLDRSVDDIFFEDLWMDMEKPSEEASRNWLYRIFTLARTQLQNAMTECPHHNARHYRSIAAAERKFYGAARNKYPELFQTKGEKNYVGQSDSV